MTPAAAPAKPKFTEAQVAEAYGWYMGAQMGLRQLEFTQAQIEAMARGMIGVASSMLSDCARARTSSGSWISLGLILLTTSAAE